MGYQLPSTDTVDSRDISHFDPVTKYTVCHSETAWGPIFIWVLSTKYTDSETGLVYYGYRYYQPEMGRWLSKDPIEERGGVSLHGFLGNNPICFLDAYGLMEVSISEPTVHKYSGRAEANVAEFDKKAGNALGFTDTQLSVDIDVKVSPSCDGCEFTLSNLKASFEIWYLPGLTKWKEWVEVHEAQHVKINKAVIKRIADAMSATKTCPYPKNKCNKAFCDKMKDRVYEQLDLKFTYAVNGWNTLDWRPGYSNPAPFGGFLGDTWVSITDLEALGDKTVERVQDPAVFNPPDWNCPK